MPYKIELDHDFVANWVTRKSKPKVLLPKETQELRIVDLFCGCGGLTNGIFEAVFSMGYLPRIALALDSNKEFLEIYRDNFDQFSEYIAHNNIENVFLGELKAEITDVENAIQNQCGEIEILVAGPPCQGHSDLNNFSRRNDPRNNLYLNCARAISILSPNIAIIENVPSVVHSKGKVVQKTISHLHDYGYFTKEFTIDFLDLGIPQTRKRHILIASKFPELIQHLVYNNAEKLNTPVLRDFITDLEKQVFNDNLMTRKTNISNTNKRRIEFLFENNIYDLPNSERPDCHKNKNHSYKSNYGRLKYNQPSQTITSGFGSMGQGRFVHPTQRRTITALEASRIQGFPNDFDFKRSKSITSLRQMIANAVPPQLSYTISKCYLDFLKQQNANSRVNSEMILET